MDTITVEDSDNEENHPETVELTPEGIPKVEYPAVKKTKKRNIAFTSKIPVNISLRKHLLQKATLEAGPSKPQASVNTDLVIYLCEIFPDVCPNYIKGLCKDKSMKTETIDKLTSKILKSGVQYPNRAAVQTNPQDQLNILIELLPEADPNYLRMMYDRFEGKPDLVMAFVNEAMEHKDYPTMKEYQRRVQLSAQQRQYTTKFNVENFIKLIPDPHNFFSDPSRVVTMDPSSTHYATIFLRNTFCKLRIEVIISTFVKNKNNLSKTYLELKKTKTQSRSIIKSIRKPTKMPTNIQNIPLLQEIAYYTHQDEIDEYLKQIKKKEEAEKQDALKKGLMKTCNCCYDEEVLPKNTFKCENGCSFCKDCIVQSTKVRYSEENLNFQCLLNCSSHFSLQTLQTVLSPKLFSKIAQKKALEEVKAAGIEELEVCPFCDFATIPAAGYSIFSCLNPECMKESCRLCKEPSHIPLKCDEVEKDDEVKARTFVENKMTEALLKKCWKCGLQFIKEEGCNKMTCNCGASMCYVCGKAVTGYKHFRENEKDKSDMCPLYSDVNLLHKKNVLKAFEEAKAEIGIKSLKHDPSADVDEYYRKRVEKSLRLQAEPQRLTEDVLDDFIKLICAFKDL